MPFAALDLHRKMTEAVVTDDSGRVVHRDRFETTREALMLFARRHLTRQHSLAIEATLNTWAVAELLAPFVGRLVVSNPLRTRAIAEAKIKTDRIDASVLAELLRCDYLPEVWQPDLETRSLRRSTTERAALVSDRTRIKNRIHAVLHQRLIPAPAGDLFSKKNLAWLDALDIDGAGREELLRQLRLLRSTETEIAATTDALAVRAWDDASAKLLMTLPGVDFTVAQTILAALGDVSRFSSADRAAAYLGLVPSTYQSGENCYHGRITKRGRSHARWMLVEAAQHVGAHPGPLGVFFRRLQRKKNRNVAVVAAARKIVTIAWHMLKNNEPYRYSLPDRTQAKFDRLRIRVTGKKKKSGLAKGSPRPENYGKGRTKAIPALASVYAGYELPPLAELKPGERSMLERAHLDRWNDSLHTPRRVPKPRRVAEPANSKIAAE